MMRGLRCNHHKALAARIAAPSVLKGFPLKSVFSPPQSFRLSTSAQAEQAETPQGGMFPHFRNSPTEHPLKVPKRVVERLDVDLKPGEWVNPTVNHVWSDEEIQARLSTQPRHQPVTFTDKLARNFLNVAYWTFNKVTGYEAADPTPESVAFRFIFLESIAGVPGMVAAQHRHFRSLRNMDRDYGWIHTLLEEAENERMHLLTFMQAFKPGFLARSSVFFTQFGFGGLFIVAYVVSPSMAHRLVGYIEEMAVVTYTNVIELMETPGTKLEKAWSKKDVPQIATMYWRLSPDATFLDVIKQIAVDETNHRDVNHTFAGMERDKKNPYIHKHLEDAGNVYTYWHSEVSTVEGKDLEFDMSPKKPISTSS